jgi:hypothetical protein
MKNKMHSSRVYRLMYGGALASTGALCADVFTIVKEYLDPMQDINEMFYTVPSCSYHLLIHRTLHTVFKFNCHTGGVRWVSTAGGGTPRRPPPSTAQAEKLMPVVRYGYWHKPRHEYIPSSDSIAPAYANHILHPVLPCRPRIMYGGIAIGFTLAATMFDSWFFGDIVSAIMTPVHQCDLDDWKAWIPCFACVLASLGCIAIGAPVWTTALIKTVVSTGGILATMTREVVCHPKLTCRSAERLLRLNSYRDKWGKQISS